MISNSQNTLDSFENRHNAPNKAAIAQMLATLKTASIDNLIDDTLPNNIRLRSPITLPKPQTEFAFINALTTLASTNKIYHAHIGCGYYNCIVPSVIQRNILENPGWYTAYTPYQAEIAQGRLEMLFNFQTMVTELTAMPLANASLLDEATAAAEAMKMLYVARGRQKKRAHKFFAAQSCHPQTIDVLKTRASALKIELVIGALDKLPLDEEAYFGTLVQYPNTNGEIQDYTAFIEEAHAHNIKVVVAADLLSLTLLKPPGEMGADVVVGTTQRLGVSLGYGGPHAAFFATRETYKRRIPGRIIGLSKDVMGNAAYRMALQTREQHIRRGKATSNICTSQVLLAVMSAAYGIYHGAEGLKNIASRIWVLTHLLKQHLEKLDFEVVNTTYFDTLKIRLPDLATMDKLRAISDEYQVNFRYYDALQIGISIDETVSATDIERIIDIFSKVIGWRLVLNIAVELKKCRKKIDETYARTSAFMQQEIFHKLRTEHELLRYLKSLENKDLSLTHGMIPLGSCTMKLNATTEMLPMSWPAFSQLHPFVPAVQAMGYKKLVDNLGKWLCQITGFEGISFQPNSGAEGEYAGLMVIRAFHRDHRESRRNIALIPASAHGTNPASAVMAGMRVIIIACDAQGNIDIEDLKNKLRKYERKIAVFMITYPSTHGVYEEDILEICEMVHKCGAKVYMDGANLNAQIGLTRPALIGADICHINLHKTFCIPHGGGGPGMGPIVCTAKLAKFLPQHIFTSTNTDNKKAINAISAAAYGSASILTISYAYIAMMGTEGLTNASKIAILNANYLKSRLQRAYPVLYTGKNDRVAHEMILDCRSFKQWGVEVEDIAKRLIDYGFHAPTVSFPVVGTMMIEPTESESKEEIDRFCYALLSIREEIRAIEKGTAAMDNNVLKNAPHTLAMVTSDTWNMPYSREKAAFPLPYLRENKFWASVGRINNAYGDRNLICSCPNTSDFRRAK